MRYIHKSAVQYLTFPMILFPPIPLKQHRSGLFEIVAGIDVHSCTVYYEICPVVFNSSSLPEDSPLPNAVMLR